MGRVTLRCLRQQIDRIVKRHAQLVRDMESWNANQTDDHTPFDVGAEKVVLAKARECQRAIYVGDTTAPCHDELLAMMIERNRED